MAEPVALFALVVDAAIGWPQALYRRIGHPVGTFAFVIAFCERRWNDNRLSDGARRALGVVTVIGLTTLAFGIAFVVQEAARHLFGRWSWVAVGILAFPAIAQRSLHDHVLAVARPLEAGRLDAARAAVGMIVGRDTAALDEAGVARAAIESLSESFCDGIVAPAFWLLVLGLPGIWAYKAINTADSMIGHYEPRWRAFGWAAARTDDVANLVPARLSGLLICIAGRGGWRIMLRDARKHASPNAGWPETAMAGVLGVRVAGPVSYDGVTHAKPWIGEGGADVSAADLYRALRIYRTACLLLWIIAGGVAWAL
ncbi:MAG: adenosylcobinamide-phosphate synthase CbiB [Sphingobium phenoxybenzoativorans]